MAGKRVNRVVRRYAGGVVGVFLLAVLAFSMTLFPLFHRIDPYTQDLRNILEAPNKSHWFGTDEFGRDLMSRVIAGGRVSVALSALAVLLGMAIGVPIGLVAGFFGGMTDLILMRVVDILLAFPFILLAVLVVTLAGSGSVNAALAIGVATIPAFARLTRSSTARVVTLEYVTAARAIGCSDLRVALRHVVPNVFTPIIIQATYSLATGVLSIGTLSFIGLGVQPPTPEWGGMLATGRRFMHEAPHVVLFPGLALCLTTIAITLIGDALRAAYEPRLRRI